MSLRYPPLDDVLTIVVNFNSSRDSLDCVTHLRDIYPSLAVTVVDNNSRPEERAPLDLLPSDVELIHMAANGGYAAGVNAGLRLAASQKYSWCWLINPDSRPLAGALETLLESSSGAVALSPLQYTANDFSAEGTAYASGAWIRNGRVLLASTHISSPVEVDVLTGTGLLISTSAAHEVGLLDESFFHYKEEFDFTVRLAQHGTLRLVPSAKVWHRRGGSLPHESPGAFYYRHRNELLYLRKRSDALFSVRQARVVARAAAASVLLAVRGQFGCARAIATGILHGLVGRGGPWNRP